MYIYDVAIVGAGPAGMMAAIRAAQSQKRAVIIERNDSFGKKILLTGNGRCNVTNSAPIESFIDKFEKQGLFLRPAFLKFSNQDLINFFETNGLKLKTEWKGCVFPITNRANSITDVLEKSIRENKIEVCLESHLVDIKIKNSCFQLYLREKEQIQAQKIILATGGSSYAQTGSTGDGPRIAKRLGHTIITPTPALVPLKTKEEWIKELQGLALKNVRLVFREGRKRTVSEAGELLFTHFGISGPLILDISNKIAIMLKKKKEITLFIDLKPDLESKDIECKLLNEFKVRGSVSLKNILKELLPQRLIAIFIRLLNINPLIKANQVTYQQRRAIVDLLKKLPLTIIGTLPLEEAMVTNGGVSTKDINPRTMESKIIPGLYFSGEIIDGRGPSGGYNLQQAFSTGYLAGESCRY